MTSCFIFCVDNSEYMRNGDYPPTRLQAQAEAVNFMIESQSEQGRYPVIGVVSLADCKVLTMPTRDKVRIANSLKDMTFVGSSRASRSGGKASAGGLNIAGGLKLALKMINNHTKKISASRRKKVNHRIFAFLGSPAAKTQGHLATYRKLAKSLGKKRVSVDFVCLGEPESEANVPILNGFTKTVNESLLRAASKAQLALTSPTAADNQEFANSQASHVVTVEPGLFLADALVGSALMPRVEDMSSSEEEDVGRPAENVNSAANAGAEHFVAVLSIDDILQVLASEGSFGNHNPEDLIMDDGVADIFQSFLGAGNAGLFTDNSGERYLMIMMDDDIPDRHEQREEDEVDGGAENAESMEDHENESAEGAAERVDGLDVVNEAEVEDETADGIDKDLFDYVIVNLEANVEDEEDADCGNEQKVEQSTDAHVQSASPDNSVSDFNAVTTTTVGNDDNLSQEGHSESAASSETKKSSFVDKAVTNASTDVSDDNKSSNSKKDKDNDDRKETDPPSDKNKK